ncbi:MAG: hypothetical protein AABW54_00360 [Candidatus Micrarchaeota archaeon]
MEKLEKDLEELGFTPAGATRKEGVVTLKFASRQPAPGLREPGNLLERIARFLGIRPPAEGERAEDRKLRKALRAFCRRHGLYPDESHGGDCTTPERKNAIISIEGTEERGGKEHRFAELKMRAKDYEKTA